VFEIDDIDLNARLLSIWWSRCDQAGGRAV